MVILVEFKIYYRYDNSKRELLNKKDLEDKFYGIIIPCTTAMYFQNSVITFLEVFNKPFFMDPMTYFLNQPSINITKRSGSIRRSYMKIIKEFLGLNKEQIEEYVNDNREFVATDISDEDLEVFCSKVINFQKTFIKSNDMMEFIGLYEELLDPAPESKTPEYLIPPYFRIEHGNDSYKLNKRCIEIAQNIVNEDDPPLCGCFAFTKSFINYNEDIAEKIIEDFPNLTNFLIWISDFNATKEKVNNLNKMKNIVKTLSNEGKNIVINLYGDYFSLLLLKFGLTGVSSGIGTSTKKTARLSRGSGGGFTTKIYVPKINISLIKDDYKRLLDVKPEIVCDCPKCRKIIGGLNKKDPDFTYNYYNLLLSNNNFEEHFIYSLDRDKEFVEKSALSDLIEDIEEKDNIFSSTPYAAHLKRWKEDI